MHVSQQWERLCRKHPRVCIGWAWAHQQAWRDLQQLVRADQVSASPWSMLQWARTSSCPFGPSGALTSRISSPGLALVKAAALLVCSPRARWLSCCASRVHSVPRAMLLMALLAATVLPCYVTWSGQDQCWYPADLLKWHWPAGSCDLLAVL